MPGGRYPGLQSESFFTVAGFVMASLKLDAAAHVQDPSRLARRVSVLHWGTLPLGAAPLPVRSPQRRGFSFRPGGLLVSGSDQLRAAIRVVHAGECVAQSDVPSDHALVASLDGLMPCETLKLMAAAIASQPPSSCVRTSR